LGALAQIHQYCIALPWQIDIYGCALYLVNSKARSMLPTAYALSIEINIVIGKKLLAKSLGAA